MTDRELMQMALDALEEFCEHGAILRPLERRDALRAALAQPEREWQTLTENEIKHLWYEACQTNLELTSQLIVHLARNIEAKLKEKNG